jgi:hypothetical protein
MAKIEFGNGVLNISGTVDGNTFSRNKYGAYLKRKAIPIQPSSTYQLIIRSYMREITNCWAEILTEDEKKKWNKATVNKKDSLGKSIKISGVPLFVMCNSMRKISGLEILKNCPVNFNVPEVPASVVINTETAGGVELPDQQKMDIYFTPSPLPEGMSILVQATKELSLGVNYTGGKGKIIGIWDFEATSPITVNGYYNEIFGVVSREAKKDKIKIGWVVKALNKENGMTSRGVSAAVVYGKQQRLSNLLP